MESLDRVRKAFGMYTNVYTERGEERVDDLFDSVENEVKERYIELPTDADGFPIHIGDEMVDHEKNRFVVSEIDYSASCVCVFGIASGVGCLYSPSDIAHHHEPAVEDVLREFTIACEDAGNAGDAVNRLISEYAERFQLKEESGE
jgi:hypothetical protein